MLDPDWVDAHADEFDLMHIHFGFDARDPDDLRALTDALRRANKPLFLTVHDLRNPHHEESGLHDRQLDALIPAAHTVITLTPGAAAEIRRRWGVEATVLPHPHVFDLDDVGQPRTVANGFVVGLHCKSLRACMDPAPIVRAVVDLLPELPGTCFRVDAHNDIMDPGNPRYAAELAQLLRAEAEKGTIDLHVHDYFTHDELRSYLRGLDVSVLPYRFGTHSGWAEGCHDLGTGVVAPEVGFYAEQLACFTYRWHDDGSLDTASLRSALRTAYETRGSHPLISSAERRLQRTKIAAVHERLYRAALAG